jgi:hypothetical protein
MMEGIQAWIGDNRLYAFPNLAVSVPNESEYLEWKKS